MKDQDEPVEYVRLYVYQGRVYHLVNAAFLGKTRSESTARAACSYMPSPPWAWQGTDVGEYERARQLRMCGRCRTRLEEIGVNPDEW